MIRITITSDKPGEGKTLVGCHIFKYFGDLGNEVLFYYQPEEGPPMKRLVGDELDTPTDLQIGIFECQEVVED